MPSIDDHLRSAAALVRLMNPRPRVRAIAELGAFAVDESIGALSDETATLRTRWFEPRGRSRGAVMLAHGMHHLGGEEPRLLALGRNLAQAGLVVAAPHFDALAGYRLDPAAVPAIAAASRAVSRRIGRADVGVVGVSLGAGAAILAATDARLGASIRFVLAIGAHDDLARVASWCAGGRLTGPKGERFDRRPDPYGLLLLLHDAPELCFPRSPEVARDALALALADRTLDALAVAARMPDDERRLLRSAIEGEPEPELGTKVRAMLEERRAELDAVSPRANLGPRRPEVLLMHGREDRLIPPTESMHLRAALGPSARLLLTGAIGHADKNPDVGIVEKVALVRFMARVFELAR